MAFDISRENSLALLHEYTKSESLIKHALSVEAAMNWYAEKLAEDRLLWGATGLLHDFDYEKFPTYNLDLPEPEGHPFSGCKILTQIGYPAVITEAILGHAKYSGVPRESSLAKHLFACDELCGLITAAVLVRPDKSIHNLEVKSVTKKMKDKAFARGVDRDDIRLGAEEIKLPLEEHIANVISSMRAVALDLGLNGL